VLYLKKIVLFGIAALLIFSLVVTSVKSDVYSETWYFGYDRDDDGEIDDPYGSIDIYIECPDSVTGSFTVTLKITYNDDIFARADYIYFSSLTIKIIDYYGNVKVSKYIGDTNNLTSGDYVQFDEILNTPDASGTYYVSISFTLHWFYLGKSGYAAFDLYEAEGIPSNLPSFEYYPTPPPVSGSPSYSPFGGYELIIIGGVVGATVILAFLLTKGGIPLGASSKPSYQAVQTEAMKPSIAKTTTVQQPPPQVDIKSLESLTLLEGAVRVFVLDFEVKWLSLDVKNVLISFSTAKGVKILKIVVRDKYGDPVLKATRSYTIFPEKVSGDNFRLMLYVLKPVGVSIQDNLKARVYYKIGNKLQSFEIVPNQYLIDKNIVVSFSLRKSLSDVINSLLKGLSGLQKVVEEFATLSLANLLPKVSIHNIRLRNIGDSVLRNIEVALNVDKFVLSGVKDDYSEAVNIVDSKVIINEIKPGDECYFSIISKTVDEDFELSIRIDDKVAVIKNDSMSLDLPNILLSYSRLNVQKMTKVYLALSSLIKSLV